MPRPAKVTVAPEASPPIETISVGTAAGAAAGGHASFEAAQQSMSSLKEKRFTPDPRAKAAYDELYAL